MIMIESIAFISFEDLFGFFLWFVQENLIYLRVASWEADLLLWIHFELCKFVKKNDNVKATKLLFHCFSFVIAWVCVSIIFHTWRSVQCFHVSYISLSHSQSVEWKKNGTCQLVHSVVFQFLFASLTANRYTQRLNVEHWTFTLNVTFHPSFSSWTLILSVFVHPMHDNTIIESAVRSSIEILLYGRSRKALRKCIC